MDKVCGDACGRCAVVVEELYPQFTTLTAVAVPVEAVEGSGVRSGGRRVI
jgi:hypothetical protein